jgi:phospholipase A1
MKHLAVVVTTLVLAVPAQFAQSTDTMADCAAVRDDAERLRCYDRVSRPTPAPSAAPTAAPARGFWAERIEKDAARETFTLTARKPNYIMYSALSTPNQQPYEFTGQADRLDNDEIKFQLSFQTKMADDLFGRNGDLWFSYTQVAYWQLFNSDISAPFRETNYEPDIYLSFLTDYSLLGLTGRSINIGVVHQSNGRAEPLSRSWNRVYAEFQFVRGDFGLSFKPWARIKEDAVDDNNPDIEDYLGHYELRAFYNWNGHIFTAMLRNVFDDEHRYNSELQWSFPIARRLRGLVQWYNGYGENLIDYKHNNHRLGVGVLMTDWL